MAKEVEKNENYFKRFIDEETGIEYGFYQVLFGVRFRAGWLENKINVQIDWCCGTSQTNMILAITAFENALKVNKKDVFSKLPMCSKIKPFDKDPEFFEMITKEASLKNENSMDTVKIEKVEERD